MYLWATCQMQYFTWCESHVYCSIHSPAGFIQSNIVGTFNLLECSRHYIQAHELKHNKFRFLHISTDEVFGSLDMKSPAFSESDPYRPNLPYSASKASSYYLVRAWQKTFGVPAIITNCSNNDGPFEYPEKLIPLLISKALAGEAMLIYGIGDNIRDWLYVNDHIKALETVLYKRVIGECYNIGGDHEISNLDLALSRCRIMDHKRPDGAPHEGLITFVA